MKRPQENIDVWFEYKKKMRTYWLSNWFIELMIQEMFEIKDKSIYH